MMLEIFPRIVTKVINMICGRTYFSWISSPFIMFTKGVSNSLVIMALRVIDARKLNFCFKPIQRNCKSYRDSYIKPVGRTQFNKKNHSNQSQYYKEMPPSKLHHFNGFIKNVLHFMYGLIFHVYFLSHVCIMPLKRLKSLLQNEEFFNFLSYSGKKSSIWLKFQDFQAQQVRLFWTDPSPMICTVHCDKIGDF